jgi:hypothetical protein
MEFHIMAIKKSSGSGIPFGNIAGRPANPGTGQLYSNGEAQRLELYTAAGNWENIVQEVPGVSSITGTYSEQANSGTITIYGTNFVNGAYATAIGSNGVQINASSTTFNSLVQLTATFTGLSNAQEPYDIKVTNPSNLFGLLPDALYVNASPVWQTTSGSLGTFYKQVSITLSALSATDSDSTVTYALASGSTLPSGVTLNSSTGVISGTLPNISSDTTYNFTINASDGVNTIPRSFSITSQNLVSIEFLAVGGGGAGGTYTGGGGGAGGLVTTTLNIIPTSTAIVVGQGGAASRFKGANGNDSSVFGYTASGGGAGGGWAPSPGRDGNSGGSGGGAGEYGGTNLSTAGSSTQNTYSGIGFGNSGGLNISTADPGGGGGAGGAGSPSSGGAAGAGGIGRQSSITGTATYYAGGGGGSDYNRSSSGGGAGGLGGGGAGNGGSGNFGVDGTPNTGGGGGGGGSNESGSGGSGGSGVVIIAYPNTVSAITTIPGTLTYDQPTRSGYRVYRFTAGSGTITF